VAGIDAQYATNTSGLSTDEGAFTPANVLFIPSPPEGDIPLKNLYRSVKDQASPADKKQRADVKFQPQEGKFKVNLRRVIQPAQAGGAGVPPVAATVTIEVELA
jgi:hypothetical protein